MKQHPHILVVDQSERRTWGRHFWLARSINREAPLARALGGTICLFRKAGKPADELGSYRPITLQNADVKLVMLVLSTRLQRPLDHVISISQGAFLQGRDISDNVRYVLGLRARLQELGLPAWLLQSD